MPEPHEKYKEIKNTYITSHLELRDFSRESGIPGAPALSTINRWASPGDAWNNPPYGEGKSWQQLREEYWNGISAITQRDRPIETVPEIVKKPVIQNHEVLGRYGAYMPEKLALATKQMLDDPYFYSLADEIAVIGAYTVNLFERLKTQSPPDQLWHELGDAVQGLEKASKSGQDQQVEYYSGQVMDIIKSGNHQALIMQEIFQMFEKKANMIDLESKRAQRSRGMLPIEAVMQFFNLLKVKMHELIITEGYVGEELWEKLAVAIDDIVFKSVARSE